MKQKGLQKKAFAHGKGPSADDASAGCSGEAWVEFVRRRVGGWAATVQSETGGAGAEQGEGELGWALGGEGWSQCQAQQA